ncbi:MAG: methyl-accepting chemotaxis protein [Betaproteobacteria bacterium]
MKALSLRTKIASLAIGAASIAFAVTFSAIAWIARDQARDAALDAAKEIARSHANDVKSEFMRTYTTVNSLTSALTAMKTSGYTDRQLAQDVAKDMLNTNTQLIGLSSYWEPNAFDGKDAEWHGKPGHDKTGRFMAYWNRSSGKIAVEPTVDYDNEEKSPWYFVPKKTGKFFATEPYAFSVAGKDIMMVSLMSPIIVGGKFLGVSGSDYPLSTLQEILAKVKPYDVGYAALITQGGKYASNPDSKKLNAPAADVPASIVNDFKVGKSALYIDENGWVNVFEPIQIGVSDTFWSLKVSFPLSAVMSGANRIVMVSIVLAILSIALLALFMIPLLRALTSPLILLTSRMSELAEGQGDLTKRLPVKSEDEIGQISAAFNSFMDKLRELVSQIASQSSQLDVDAQNLASTSREVALRSNEQSDESSATAAAMEEIAVSIAHVAESAGEARASVDQANELTRNAQEQLMETVNEIGSISESMRTVSTLVGELDGRARDIGSITAVINDIAGQTNLLALNAAIEAARAGEQGRGFAVVADEVRKLAERTTQATHEISDKLSIIQQGTARAVGSVNTAVDQVGRGVQLSQTAATSIAGISEASNRLVDQIGEIDHAVKEQNVAGNDIARRLESISSSAQEIDASVKNNVAAAGELKTMADSLQMLVHKFKV